MTQDNSIMHLALFVSILFRMLAVLSALGPEIKELFCSNNTVCWHSPLCTWRHLLIDRISLCFILSLYPVSTKVDYQIDSLQLHKLNNRNIKTRCYDKELNKNKFNFEVQYHFFVNIISCKRNMTLLNGVTFHGPMR